MTRQFAVDTGWAKLMAALGLRVGDVLRAADLPEDLFTRRRAALDNDEFIRLWQAFEEALGAEGPGLIVGSAVTPDVFSPPVFAAFCSPDLVTATQRLSQYKPLIGPFIFEVHDMTGGLELTFAAEDDITLPNEFVAAELVFQVHLARLATRHDINPIAVEMIEPSTAPAYTQFFGHNIRQGPFNRVVFSPRDARRPFVSANAALFEAFEPELRTRLDELAREASVADRVRATLMEALPSGQGDTANVAKRLGMSTRSLQRKLGAEGTSFQTELQNLRTRLAKSYLSRPDHSSAEIAYLLGYEDPNSFIRAFHTWTGTTPEAMRRAS